MFKKIGLTSLLMASALGFGLVPVATPASADIGDYGYYDYDYDQDGFWNEDEWTDYSYDTIDYDNDGLIGEDEWNDYSNVWYEPYDYDYDIGFSDYDYDNDGFWDEDEYADAYDDDLFGAWDTNDDDLLDDNEWNDTLSMYDDADSEGIFDW